MRRAIVATMILLFAPASHAQPVQTLRSVLAQGYEIKAFDSSRRKIYLQKGSSAYYCALSMADDSANGVANASCAPLD